MRTGKWYWELRIELSYPASCRTPASVKKNFCAYHPRCHITVFLLQIKNFSSVKNSMHVKHVIKVNSWNLY